MVAFANCSRCVGRGGLEGTHLKVSNSVYFYIEIEKGVPQRFMNLIGRMRFACANYLHVESESADSLALSSRIACCATIVCKQILFSEFVKVLLLGWSLSIR